jgi:HSP20 family protein
MSAQRSSQQSTSTSSRSEQGRESTALAQRSALPSLPSLLLDPFGFFSDDDPFTLLRGIQREMSRAFGQGLQGRRTGNGNGLSTTIWVPPIEVQYKDGNFVVSAELPGLRDEDVSVAITDDSIVISGERQEQHEETQGGMRRSELRYGQFYRAIPLPDGADPEKAQAEFKNGVLQITLPVSEARSNVRQIPVQTATSSQSASGQAGSQTAGQSTQQKPTGSESGQKAA